MNILGIIPARGGSKQLKRKNMLKVAGKPLICYTIEATEKSKKINRFIVSSEDSEIIEFSIKNNFEVIKRPIHIAQDDSPILETIFHILTSLEKEEYSPDIVVLLQPTSPLRLDEDIDKAINLFLENKENCDAVISVCELEHSPYWGLKTEDRYLKPILGYEYLNKRRQDLPSAYMPNGAIFVSTPEYLKFSRSFYSKRTIPYVMSAERSIDIDTKLDMELAQLILMEKKKNE